MDRYRQARPGARRRHLRETQALSGIHLDIRKGEYVSIAGPSGCGKSTLLSILGLLDSPTEGAYQLNGRVVREQVESDPTQA